MHRVARTLRFCSYRCSKIQSFCRVSLEFLCSASGKSKRRTQVVAFILFVCADICLKIRGTGIKSEGIIKTSGTRSA